MEMGSSNMDFDYSQRIPQTEVQIEVKSKIVNSRCRMEESANFRLYKYITTQAPNAAHVLAGSAPPALNLGDIVSCSIDPDVTREALSHSTLSSALTGHVRPRGSLNLQQAVANLYDADKSKLSTDNVLIVNGTTGANHIVFRSLLKPGDHVIINYPTYGPLIEEPRDVGCDISYWRLRSDDDWILYIEDLKALIRPGETKMIVVNNPANPTGTFVATSQQREILKIAKEHDIIVLFDEIFRPLFHVSSHDKSGNIPRSANEHKDGVEYDKVITTGSMTKVYGLGSIRVGWIATRKKELLGRMEGYRGFSMQYISLIDEVIATEALSERCRRGILEKHLDLAKKNIQTIDNFVRHWDGTNKNQKWMVAWTKPTAGAVGFPCFSRRTADNWEPVDDVEFCQRLLKSKGMCLAPASQCFEISEKLQGIEQKLGDLNLTREGGKGEFKGRVRFHLTAATDVVESGVKALKEFLGEEW